MQMTPPTVFVSYCRDNEKEKDELLAHLRVLQQGADLVDVWSDDLIGAGADWEQEIKRVIGRAKVAILLITKEFLTSDFILKKEIPELLARREREGLTVFPVLARPCAWMAVDWLTKMNVRPKKSEYVWRAGGQHADEYLADIAREVAEILKKVSETLNLPAEVQAALEACFQRRREHIDRILPTDLQAGVRVRLDSLWQAMVTEPIDLDKIEAVLKAARNEPLIETQLRLLLQEPALQRLARQAGPQLIRRYERLVFGEG